MYSYPITHRRVAKPKTVRNTSRLDLVRAGLVRQKPSLDLVFSERVFLSFWPQKEKAIVHLGTHYLLKNANPFPDLILFAPDIPQAG